VKSKLAALLTLVVALGLMFPVGCKKPKPMTPADYVGYWEVDTSNLDDGLIPNSEMNDMMKSIVATMFTFDLRKDGTCTVSQFGKPLEGTWSLKKDELVVLDGGKVPMTIKVTEPGKAFTLTVKPPADMPKMPLLFDAGDLEYEMIKVPHDKKSRPPDDFFKDLEPKTQPGGGM